MLNDFGVPTSASKRKCRKPKYLKGYKAWCGVHQETRKMAARASRKNNRIEMTIDPAKMKRTPDQGKRQVAANRCGNGCGRRAVMKDYLCPRCRG
jgi:hypothetical protein